jgi:adhesin transport system outer membrane protein
MPRNTRSVLNVDFLALRKNTCVLLMLKLLVFVMPRTVFALSIEDVIKATVEAHPAIQSQLAQLDASLADVQTARQQFYPTPSISVEQVSSSAGDWQYGQKSTVQAYRLQQPLWTGGRLTAGLDKAQANSKVASENVNDVRQQMAFRAVQAWSEWYLAALRVRAQGLSVETHERLMGVVRRRVAEGAMATSELSLTQSRLDQAIAQQQSFLAQQKVARLKVSQLIGRSLNANELPELVNLAVQCRADTLSDRAIEASAALKKINAQQESLGFEVKERQAELKPEIYLRLERQRSPYQSGTVMTTFDRAYVGFSSRFGAGLSNLTAIESLEKRRNALTAEYEAAQRNLLEAVQSEQEQLESITARLPLLRNAMEASSQTAQAWDRQFLAGRRAWIEVMNAAREMAQAEIDFGDANASQISSQWRMSIYCGELQDTLMASKQSLAREAQK